MKVYTYVVIMFSMLLFLSFIGFQSPATAAVFNATGIGVHENGTIEKADVTQAQLFTFLFDDNIGKLLLVGLGSALAVGFLTKTFDWKLVLVAFMTGIIVPTFVSVGWDLIQFAQTTNAQWLVSIVAVIFGALTVGFIFSVFEFFAGGGD